MKIRIYAHFCEFDGIGRSHTPLDKPAYSLEAEISSADALGAAMDVAFDAVKATNPGRSFFVGAYRVRARGSRAFAGFASRNWLREFDAAEAVATS